MNTYPFPPSGPDGHLSTPRRDRIGLHPPAPGDLAPGTWVVFTRAHFFDPHNIVLEGMIGQVDAHPYAHHICTPGVSTMILPLGARESFGYPNTIFAACAEEPDEAAQEASRGMWRDSLRLYEERHYGYTGFVQIGQQRMRGEDALRELIRLVPALDRAAADPSRASEARGLLRRIVKTLGSFARHPEGDLAVDLAARIGAAKESAEKRHRAVEAARQWAEKRLALDAGRHEHRAKRG